MPPRKSRSGSYVPEELRGTVRTRVPREPAEALAKRWECSSTEAVVRAVREASERLMSTSQARDEERSYQADREYDRTRDDDLRER